MTTRACVLAWVALLALTAVSFVVSRLHVGAFEMPVAMIIATVKGAAVLLVFMHLAKGRFVYAYVFGIAMLYVGVLIVLASVDLATRR